MIYIIIVCATRAQLVWCEDRQGGRFPRATGKELPVPITDS